ncbi:MAG: hypothetical protein PHU71_07570 [Candidatus Gracilibacteria bacterium]|nr:hypothetical protein [Candidatus Gracilibacteria bacterium]
MNNKQLIVARIVLLTIFISFSSLTYASWSEYKNIRYMDVDGELGGQDEIIIESKHGAGTGTYVEHMRIFKDDFPDLKLIFHIQTLESYFGPPEYNYDEVSEVKFTEPSPKGGSRDIAVHSKTIYYKDAEHKVVDREEDAGVKVFKWNGKKFVEDKSKGKAGGRGR